MKKMTKMKILILSWEPWNNTNTFGNSYSAIWDGMNNVEIANIYCRYGHPYNDIVSRYFQITEKTLIKNLIYKNIPSGKEIFYDKEAHQDSDIGSAQSVNDLSNKQLKIVNWIRTHRLQILFWVRDLIWNICRWKSKALNDFVDSFNPDIIFVPIYYSTYLNDMCVHLKKYSGKKMVGYISDDNYTLKQFNLSPFYWIDRLIKRPHIKKVIKNCEFIYTITDRQKEEYEKIFNIECKLLWKGANFSKKPAEACKSIPVKIVFMGNLGLERWKTLAGIVKELSIINANECKANLFIYSLTPRTTKMEHALNVEGTSQIMPVAAPEEVEGILADANIVLHVEPYKLKYRLMYRHSFSTKIVDYFHCGRCILAVGGNTGTMDYLRRNDAAIVITDKKQLAKILSIILFDDVKLNDYSFNAWNCGVKNHQLSKIQRGLYEDLQNIC